ncbi:unnamed protein product [Commensalibacter communis]|uniref:hypothetical protein n=1 Tax=Commensalibacter communis TaxID=2972786 RepID=UPI0022FF68FE|nr:hypothetical protein [Commensalibacter communis]CAI3924835.1 unnamed protein product [Commensalibacter communis]CAI3934525.1 unnamed protein product [Commensalibacter communis]
MSTHKTGVVLSPKHYKNWCAEYVSDSTDTGGIYVILRHTDHWKPVTFWEVTLNEMEQTLKGQNIIILWEGEHTISSFLSSDNLTKKFAKKITENFYTRTEATMAFNLTQLAFDFESALVIVSYYVEQETYPDIVLSFEQLEALLLEYLTQ